MTKFDIDTRVEAGKPGTDDYDTGTVLDPEHGNDVPHGPDAVYVAWDSGVRTWISASDLRPI